MDAENNVIALKNENEERSFLISLNGKNTMARILTVLLLVSCLSLSQHLRICLP